MKKVIIALAAIALFASCQKSDKCKCTFDSSVITLKDVVVPRPEEKTCGQLKIEDIKGSVVSIDLSKVASVKCSNYNE